MTANAPQLKTAAMELQSISVTSNYKVWYLVGMDLICPFKPTVMGHQFVLTMTDHFNTEYVEDKFAVLASSERNIGGLFQTRCTCPHHHVIKNAAMRRKTLHTSHRIRSYRYNYKAY